MLRTLAMRVTSQIATRFRRWRQEFSYPVILQSMLLQIFWSKEMKCPPSSIDVDMHITSQQGHAIFLSRQPLIILHSKLYSALRSLKTFKTSTNQYLVRNEYFYMVNPCCDVTNVNEMKHLSKMADISLLQVKIFQELSKIWKIGKRSWYVVSKVLSNEKIKNYIAISLGSQVRNVNRRFVYILNCCIF
jgi:galactitol-specific phosphotransferase system IIB component